VRPRALAPVALATIGLACVTAACWIHVKAFAAQVLISAAWDRTQHGAAQAHPWPWADTTPVARLTFHDAKALVVLEGSSGRNLAFAPGHDAASVLPGDAGNSVISAHRDTHFRLLEHVRVGDRIQVERPDGRRVVFSVTDVSVVDSRAARIALDSAEPRLTLVTCYPFDAITPGGPLRFVVTANSIAGAGHPPPQRVAHAAAFPLESAQPRQLPTDSQRVNRLGAHRKW
jgi:sortase A